MYSRSKKKRVKRVEWVTAPDIKVRVNKIIRSINIDWENQENIYFFRSNNSKSRAYARIWGLSRIWQEALGKKPSYIIEVISERFDKLGKGAQNDVLIHELAHIPKNFSGSLIPHYKRGKRNFRNKVKLLISKYNKK